MPRIGRYIGLVASVLGCLAGGSDVCQAQALDDFEPDLPVVLSPIRLQQPMPEVPASATLITAEQIRLWGIQRLVDVFQYVPGMFVAQELDSNQSGVVYHSGDLSLSRRLEVLVDGRSVYGAIFASVDWDQLNIALEDIERIEITRGSSASSYGMNAFQGVINIVTRHPGDSRSLDVSASLGSDSRRRGYLSTAFDLNGSRQRLSAFGSQEGTAGDYDYESGDLPDYNRMVGLNWSGASDISDDLEVFWQAGRQNLQRNILVDENFHEASPEMDATTDFVSIAFHGLENSRHEWKVKAYWQAENQEKSYRACTATIAYDPNLRTLFNLDSELATALGYGVLPLLDSDTTSSERTAIEQYYSALAYGLMDASTLQAYLASAGVDTEVSEEELALAQQIAATAVGADGLDETTCGQGDYDLYEQRWEMEVENTIWWNRRLRSVQGLVYRRDEVNSQAYFGRALTRNSLMAFSSVEYRLRPDWLMFFSLTAEHQTDSSVNYSPRFAVTHLLTPDQSLRFQYSQTHRSPDLAEQYLNANADVTQLTDNYLGLDSGSLFLTVNADDWNSNLEGESIHAWEVGYYGAFLDPRLSVDIKFFHEWMFQLIEGQVNLLDGSLDDNNSMTLMGMEWQLDWRLARLQRLWLVGLLQHRELSGSNEGVLGAERSLRAAWTYTPGNSEWMLGLILDEGNGSVGSGFAGQQFYRQRKVQSRFGHDFGHAGVALSVQYDADGGQLYFERTPRWLTWVNVRFRL
ncbi:MULTISPECIES: TonB-dependent siderophore receptor [unclassified Oceanobacter]|uniref:TonB-dependent receptor plug domain-containing protein n=1 Tax=unclassified Oceanobacter TaxID=2620260 RepID=UPI0027355D2D|nr:MULTISPECIES: TonB-dependent receptor [unclassified Oceanobacter]MDP2609380.1 TonB-dependent receptor [Oceanobacter sp. 1_MG-2023]MDP2612763.1 TonB-dependent receptor [Oceanobacter sp. 2_MG-2023]